ncbi:MAG TPA: EAL domain-containing protein [Methylophilaceae bacterium]|nr:EAL domain-containing protein [Methylophilaceae bacterium]
MKHPFNFDAIPMIFTGSKRLAVAKAFDTWIGMQAGTLLIACLLIAATWFSTLNRLEREEQLVIDHAQASQRTLNIIISENLEQVLNRSQIYRIAASQWFEEDRSQVETRIAGMLASDAVFTRVALFDARGGILYASSPSAQDGSIKPAIGMMFAAHDSKPELSVGPLSGAFGESWHVPLLFPVADRSGTRVGVLMLLLDLGYVLRLYQNIDIGKTGAIHVLMENGREIARARRGGLELNKRNDAAGESAALALKTGALIANDGKHLVSTRKLEHHPFAIVIRQEVADVLHNYNAIKKKHLITVAFLTLIVLGSAVWITFILHRQQKAFNSLAASEEEKRTLIQRLEEEKQRALALASQDHLTGLANRRMFMELATSHLFHNKRSRLHSALLFIDLDRFKAINDTLGHHVGDLLLQTVATRLRVLLRESDVISRFGGDEFVLLLTSLESEEAISGIAQRIVDCISERCHDLAGHDIQVFPSIGIAISPRDGQDVDQLIHHADLAMYQSKQSRSGSFTFFDASLNVRNVLQFELEQRFGRAIQEHEFVLHFQPKVELSTYRIVGLEALVRWHHPEHGLIYPGDFIPLAENTGHIVELGNWVIEAACRQLAEWKKRGVPPTRVAVNVSARQLRDDALVAHIRDCLHRYELRADAIEIEVTESSLMESIDVAGDILNQIAGAGIKVALDDFGNGFSSLGYIKTLPIDTLKIDRAFIADIRNSHDDAVIVDSTIALAHNLGMRVVAEGIETKDQLVHLKTAGCDEVQGYYFSRPVTADQIQELLIKKTLIPR